MMVRQAGGVVVKGDRAVLRLTPRGEYLFPKGHIEPDESPEQTALREVAEETGLEAQIVAGLGEVSFEYQGDEYRVTFYLMRATGELPEWPEHLGKDVVLLPWEHVPATISFESYRELWTRAERLLRPARDAS